MLHKLKRYLTAYLSQHVVTTRSHHLDKGKDDLTKCLSSGLVASCQQSVSNARRVTPNTQTGVLDCICFIFARCDSVSKKQRKRGEGRNSGIETQTGTSTMSTRKCNAANDLADLMSHCQHLETICPCSAAKAHAEPSQLFSLTDALPPPLAALPNATRRAEPCANYMRRAEPCPTYIVPPPPAGTRRRAKAERAANAALKGKNEVP